jgi:two-component system, response regulator YesN
MSYTILLVDDDDDFRYEFRSLFDDYRIKEASSGEEALSILKKPNEIDLVVLDVALPGQRGTKVLKEIKDIDPSLGVIILTGHSSKDIAVEALKARADDFIEKPLNIEKSKEIIKLLLEKKGITENIDAADIKEKIERVKLFTEKNYDKKISLDDAAKLIFLSPKYFSRVFKEIAGTGFNEFKLEIKLNKAKDFLEKSGYTVDEIAYKIGYENTESFIRIFKKTENCTPTEYRHKNKK